MVQQESQEEIRKGPWTEQEDFQLMCFVGLKADWVRKKRNICEEIFNSTMMAKQLLRCSWHQTFPINVRSKTTSSQFMASRARDPTFEKLMDDYKNLLKVVSIQDLILANPANPHVSLDFLSALSQKLHLNRGAASFLWPEPAIVAKTASPESGSSTVSGIRDCDVAVFLNCQSPESEGCNSDCSRNYDGGKFDLCGVSVNCDHEVSGDQASSRGSENICSGVSEGETRREGRKRGFSGEREFAAMAIAQRERVAERDKDFWVGFC